MKSRERLNGLRHFWISPLIIGIFLATGYSITKRVLTQTQASQKASEGSFKTNENVSEQSLKPFKKEPKQNVPAFEESQKSKSNDAKSSINEDQTNLGVITKKEKVDNQLRKDASFNPSPEAQDFFNKKNADDLLKVLPLP